MEWKALNHNFRLQGAHLLTAVTLIALVFCAFSSPQAYANKFNTEVSSSARALGMGNAAINTERGPYSVFYNPANISAKDTGNRIQLVNFQLDGNAPLVSMASSGSIPKINDLSSLYGDLRNNPDTYVSGRYSVYPNVTLRQFSLGILYEVNQGAEVRNSDGALRVRARDRFGPIGAVSFRLFKGIFRIGASAQLLTVGDADSLLEPPIAQSSLDFKNNINSGSGLVTNAGVTLTLPFRFLPSFSVVARNIGGTRFTAPPMISFGSGRDVAPQPMTFDAAASLTIYLARRLEMKAEIDYRDYSNKLSGSRFRHVFFGSELIFYDLMKLRTGVAHGYISFGFGIGTPKASLELALYSDEKDDRLRGSPDTRYVLQYSWGLFK
ncbi:MAG: hypothetical protein AB1540_03385 [Bdellovibrionota bacterium]